MACMVVTWWIVPCCIMITVHFILNFAPAISLQGGAFGMCFMTSPWQRFVWFAEIVQLLKIIPIGPVTV